MNPPGDPARPRHFSFLPTVSSYRLGGWASSKARSCGSSVEKCGYKSGSAVTSSHTRMLPGTVQRVRKSEKVTTRLQSTIEEMGESGRTRLSEDCGAKTMVPTALSKTSGPMAPGRGFNSAQKTDIPAGTTMSQERTLKDICHSFIQNLLCARHCTRHLIHSNEKQGRQSSLLLQMCPLI